MKLSLRHFLIVCLLLGAVALPVAWHQYQKWQAQKVEALQEKLEAAYVKQPPMFIGFSQQPPNAWTEWEEQVEKLEDRVHELTGVKPVRPKRPVNQNY